MERHFFFLGRSQSPVSIDVKNDAFFEKVYVGKYALSLTQGLLEDIIDCFWYFDHEKVMPKLAKLLKCIH